MVETGIYISRRYQLQAQIVARRLPQVMQRRGLEAPFTEFLLTSTQGMVLLFAILDLPQVRRLEAYTTPELLHHLSTDLQGLPVFLSNSNGLRYAIPLSPLPRLPKLIPFPGAADGWAQLGINHSGEKISQPWSKLGHLLVAGKTGSGKSVFLRLLAYQALAEGAQLLLVDLDGATFPMLTDHPALLAPIATTPQAAQDAIERALGECDHRAGLYMHMDGYPESLEEYNRIVLRQGGDPHPRLLVVLDEFSALMTTLGGPKSSFANRVAELGWRGRKFGVHLVFVAQDFTKQVKGRVRDQVNAAICFRVRSLEAARAMGCPEAVRIPESHPGLVCTDRWGLVQTFYLDKRIFGQILPRAVINLQEQELIKRVLNEAEGKMSIPLLVSWGMPERGARSLVESGNDAVGYARTQFARTLVISPRNCWKSCQTVKVVKPCQAHQTGDDYENAFDNSDLESKRRRREDDHCRHPCLRLSQERLPCSADRPGHPGKCC